MFQVKHGAADWRAFFKKWGALVVLCALPLAFPCLSQAQTPLPMADRDGNGLIDIDSLLMLHNMRHNLAGTSYKASADSAGNSSGCPATGGCVGYELARDLDFNVDDDGSTWSGTSDEGYSLDADDSDDAYFPVRGGAGGWLPIGNETNPFVAVFDGNSHTISNLAIRRDQTHVGLFGAIGGGASIRNLGLIDNLADYTGSSDGQIYIGGLAGWLGGSSITASYATGAVAGNDGNGDNVGGLVGYQYGGSITASYATGAAAGGDGNGDYVGGLVGFQANGGAITASYATGAAVGGSGNSDYVGGLVGRQHYSPITASYATGVAAGGSGNFDYVGGLVGFQNESLITASYATGAAAGGSGDYDRVGGLVGLQLRGSITASYGFGVAVGEFAGSAGSTKPVDTAAQLTAVNAGPSWSNAGDNSLDAWDFGDGTQNPALKYGDYDGGGDVFDCGHFPANACGTALPGQDEASAGGPAAAVYGQTVTLAGSLRFGSFPIESWSWQQLAGAEVTLTLAADGSKASFTAPLSKEPLLFELTATAGGGRQFRDLISIAMKADRDGNGLIEIDSLIELHNMRHDLAGASYKSGAAAVGNSSGCPDAGCIGYELTRDLDFDGDKDGHTWSGNSDEGYSLDADDSDDAYFPVQGGAGGWLPIGDATSPFAAVFNGNSHSISNLAIRRDQTHVGLFGAIGGGASIRNLGLIDNLADYTGSSDGQIYIGGLAGWLGGSSITASYATGAAAGGDGNGDNVGGLVGLQANGGAITASYATGAAAGGSGNGDYVGGLVGRQHYSPITASYATGVAAGGSGNGDYVGGLVGRQHYSPITASYATGVAAGGSGNGDYVGGLVGFQNESLITASYATGVAAGGSGNYDRVGGLVGLQLRGSITASYGFGVAVGEFAGSAGSTKPVDTAAQLTAVNAGPSWSNVGDNSLDAWDFGDGTQNPALKYGDYDGGGDVFDCGHFPANACGTALPGQDEASAGGPAAAVYGQTVTLAGSLRFGSFPIESWSWQQLAGAEVTLTLAADGSKASFTAPLSKEPLLFELTATASGGRQFRDLISIAMKADRDGNGLIEIDSLIELHNMRHDLAGASYKSGAAAVGNGSGCPDAGCIGYELTRDLDFDGDKDGHTWSGNSDEGYSLDADDSDDAYFPVQGGAGGWLPIGDATSPFAAVFNGNSHSISNLAIRRDQTHVGLFGAIGGGASIRNLGLIDNLVDYTGSSDGQIYIGGLAGWQGGSSITASHATGTAAGGAGDNDIVGGLVGVQFSGSITASSATGAATGGAGNEDLVGGLVGVQSDSGTITASYATGAVAGGNGGGDSVGGLVGKQDEGSITASYATGAVDGGNGGGDSVGGLLGVQRDGGSITASYATGATYGGADNEDVVGGLVGYQYDGDITASYATGAVDGGAGNSDSVGGLVGTQILGSITASYGFGSVTGELTGEFGGSDGSTKPEGVSTAAQLTAAKAGPAWNDVGSNTLGAWDFGTESQIPALNYADYDDGGDVFDCGPDLGHFPANACGTLLPGQIDQVEASAGGPSAVEPGETARLAGSLGFGRVLIESWSWWQLAGPEVALSNANARETTFTAPATSTLLVFELTATDSGGRKYTDSISLAVTAVAVPDTVVTLSGPVPTDATDIVDDELSLVYSYSADDLHGRVLTGSIEVAAAVDGVPVAHDSRVDGAGGEITVVLRRQTYPDPDEHELVVTLSAAAESFALGGPSSMTTTFSFLPLPPTVLEVRQAQAEAENNQYNQGKPGAAGSDAIELGYSFDYAAGNRLDRPRAGLVVRVEFELCTDAGYGECSSLPAASMTLTLDDGGSLTLRVDRTAAALSVFGEADDDSIRHGRVLLSTAGNDDFAATAAATTFSFAVAAAVVTLGLEGAATAAEGTRVRVSAELTSVATEMTVVRLVVVAGGAGAATDADIGVEGDDFRVVIAAGAASGTTEFTVLDDDVDEGDETLGISIREGEAASDQIIEVTILDNDTRGVDISATTLDLTAGGSGIYAVVLTSQPTAGSVEVIPTSSDSARVDVGDITAGSMPSDLVFSPENWNITRTVQVTTSSDPDARHNEVEITHQVVADADVDYAAEVAANVVVRVAAGAAPVFELEETTSVAVFLEKSIPVKFFSDGSGGSSGGPTVMVLEAPDDLAVKFDEDAGDYGAITLRRLSEEPDGNGERSREVKLVVLDGQGGRTVITIDIERLAPLPEIEISGIQSHLLLLPLGQSRPLAASLKGGAVAGVMWRVEVSRGDSVEVSDIDEQGSFTVTASSYKTGESELKLSAFDDNGRRRERSLPVVVLAAEAKPRLKLSAILPDPLDPAKTATVSGFAVTDDIWIEAALEGAVPSIYGSAATLSFRIRIAKLGADGMPEGDVVQLTAAAQVEGGDGAPALRIELVPVGAQMMASLSLKVGDLVQVSIGHLVDGEVSAGVIAGDALLLQVLATAMVDGDNDGLSDAVGGETEPDILGPIAAAIVEVTDSGVNLPEGAVTVSLSLGDLARFLGLGGCGGVTMTMTMALGAADGLTGCGDANLIDQLAIKTLTMAAQQQFGDGDYQLFDFSATFDSSEVDPGEFLVINMPVDPKTHRVYRFAAETAMWVPVIGAGLPDQPGIGGQGVLDSGDDCGSCFYALDIDRDGSVELLLLFVPLVPGDPGFAVDPSFQGRWIDIDAGDKVAPTIIPLLGLGELTATVTGNAYVEGRYIQTATGGGIVGPAVELRGLKRTRNGPERVVVEAFDDNGDAVATITLEVSVRNQAPEIEFRLLSSGEPTTSIALPPNTEMVLVVMILDPDGDTDFDLELTGGGDLARLEPRANRTVEVDSVSGGAVVINRLILTSRGARPSFNLRLEATDRIDQSKVSGRLTVCVNDTGKCSAAVGGGGGTGSGSGGGGGSTGPRALVALALPLLLGWRRRRRRLIGGSAGVGQELAMKKDRPKKDCLIPAQPLKLAWRRCGGRGRQLRR